MKDFFGSILLMVILFSFIYCFDEYTKEAIFLTTLSLVLFTVIYLLHERYTTWSKERKRIKFEEQKRISFLEKKAEIEHKRKRHNLTNPAGEYSFYPLIFEAQANDIKEMDLANWVEAEAHLSERDEEFNSQEYLFNYTRERPFKPSTSKAEDLLLSRLMQKFNGLISSGQYSQLGNYYPDILFQDKENGLAFIIEMDGDKAYVNTLEDPEPDTVLWKAIHKNEHLGSTRTATFQNAGWAVVRLATKQAYEQPEACCGFIAKAASFLSGDPKYLNLIAGNTTLKPVKCYS